MNLQNEKIIELYNMALNQLHAALSAETPQKAKQEINSAEQIVSMIENMTMLNPDASDHDIARIIQFKRSNLWNRAVEKVSAAS